MISDKTREKIIDCDYSGKSKEDNARINGVSPTTALNVVKEHENEIGRGNRESYRRIAKNANKHNLGWKEIHNGVKTSDKLNQHNVTPDKLDEFLSKFSSLQNISNLDDLMKNADLLVSLNQDTGKPYDVIVQEHQEKIIEIPKLTQIESSKTKNIENLNVQYHENLKRNNLSEEKISQHIQEKTELVKYGVSIEKSPRLAARVFHEVELLGYNPRKLVKILQEDDSVNDHTKKLKSEIQRHEKYLIALKKQVKEEKELLQFTKSFLSEYMEDIKRITDMKKLGYKVEDFEPLAKIIHKNGLTIDEFAKILDIFDGITSLIDSIILTKESLEEDIESFSLKVASLKTEKKSLEEIDLELETNVISKIEKIKEQRGTLKATAPFYAIFSNNGNSTEIIPKGVPFLKSFINLIKTNISESSDIITALEKAVKLLEKKDASIAA